VGVLVLVVVTKLISLVLTPFFDNTFSIVVLAFVLFNMTFDLVAKFLSNFGLRVTIVRVNVAVSVWPSSSMT